MIGPLKQIWGWKFKPELDYMTMAERSHFKELVKAGVISSFRIKSCSRCPKEIPNSKTYCSTECKEAHQRAEAEAKTETEENNGQDE